MHYLKADDRDRNISCCRLRGTWEINVSLPEPRKREYPTAADRPNFMMNLDTRSEADPCFRNQTFTLDHICTPRSWPICSIC